MIKMLMVMDRVKCENHGGGYRKEVVIYKVVLVVRINRVKINLIST